MTTISNNVRTKDKRHKEKFYLITLLHKYLFEITSIV